MDGYSRVINCFSYADITGGTTVGGIVGYNSYASTSDDIRTMVMNCMFYGNITGGTSKSPVYGGLKISNDNTNNAKALNNYNYYAYDKLTATIDNYNCALAAEERYLTRFEFHRNILNSNRELAAWYATGSMEDASNKIAKWVMDFTKEGGVRKYPYPILKPQGTYSSIINFDAVNAPTMTAGNEETDRNKGYKLGTLSVSITQSDNAPAGANITTSSLTLNITDKDFENYNFNYRKVQLPYYNQVGTGNYTDDKVVTGWEITVSGGTTSFTTDSYDAPDYNFADPRCTGKDNYGTSGRVFAQGGYFNVPDGVTSISIKPHWGKAIYLSDPYYDVVYNKSYNRADVKTMGKRFENNQSYTINGSSQKVYTTIDKARGQLANTAGLTVYDQAIVLVGNYHHFSAGNSIFGSDQAKPYTVMSADFNNDNEPDYSFFFQSTDRVDCAPIRFDFLNFPGIGMAQKVSNTDAPQMPNQGIFRIRGWFEVTNTCLVRFTEFEYDYINKKRLAPLILLGGVYEQITSNNTQEGTVDRTQYIHLGDNAWFKMFNNGTHADKKTKTQHVPISVTGGDYEKFYLSGMFRPDANIYTDNAECYINGGRFGELASGGMEKINGNVTFLIDHADIDNFYGGGINPAQPISGSINVTINDSHVGTYCGGPKFGDMASGKTVTTNASGTTFGTFFGAGYGGSAFNRVRKNNAYNASDYNWNGWSGGYERAYVAGNSGIATSYESEFFAWAGGGSSANVGRFYVNYASLSLATTRDVTSTLTGCTIETNFYGGGNLGSVVGNITSTLTDCNVKGYVFGAGFSASVPTVEVFPKENFPTPPSYNSNVGVYNEPIYPTPVTYTWSNTGSTENPFTDVGDTHLIYTDVNLNDLGSVTGNITLTVDGETIVGQSVYGGGDEGAVKKTAPEANNGNITVSILGETEVGPDNMKMMKAGSDPDDTGHVFGAGKGKILGVVSPIGSVAGSIELTVGGTAFIKGSVYGGGENGTVGGNTHVTIQDNCQIGNGDGINRRYTETEWANENPADFAECAHWPYDASHNGEAYDRFATYSRVEDGETVYYYDEDFTNSARGGARYAEDGRTFYGNVFGGGSGYHPYSPGQWLATAGNVAGNSVVDIKGGHILTSVYGGNEMTDVMGTATINMVGGTVGVPRTDAAMQAHPVTCYIFGAGKGDPRTFFNEMTNVKSATVNISGTARIFGSTFGGGEDGHVLGNAVTNIGGSVTIGSTAYTADTDKLIIGTTGTSGIDGNIFGGGRGYSALALTIGLVKGNVVTNISNGKIYGSVFGGGRSAAVGTYQVAAKIDDPENPGTEIDNPDYGIMMPCDGAATDDPNTLDVDETRHNHGHIFVNISGGEIGRIDPSTPGMLAVSPTGLTNSIGDVFGGGKGLAEDNRLGIVKNTTVKIYGNAKVNGSVYGGGEISSVGIPTEMPDAGGNFQTGFARVSIFGHATIGTQQNSKGEHGKGYVYGSGKGLAGSIYSDEAYVKYTEVTIGAEDTLSAPAVDDDPRVWGSVFGGGEDGHVRKDAKVFIRKGTIGAPMSAHPTDSTLNEWWFDPNTGSSKVIVYRGNVYAGGRGIDRDNSDENAEFSVTAGAVYGNASVEMTGGHVYHNIYGSGAMASVGTVTNNAVTGLPDYVNGTWTPGTGRVSVTVTGGLVGDDTPGREGRNNGRVFGAGRGLAGVVTSEVAHLAYVHSTKVTIGGDAHVLGAVYGGGENGHVKADTEVKIKDDCIIGSPLLRSECLVSTAGAKGNAFRGNVFGGGRGVDAVGASAHRSFTAGRVYGNTTVNVSGGLIYRAVYGGGMLATVGSPTRSAERNSAGTDDPNDDYFTIAGWDFDPAHPNGVATVNVTGGWIGNVTDSDQPLGGSGTTYGEPGRNNGAVFGSGAGFMATDGTSEQYSQLAYVYRSIVNISSAEGAAYPTHIRAAVFGGGENGHVWENATVNVSGGIIGNATDGSNGGDFAFAGNVFGSGRGMNVTTPEGQQDIVSTTAGWVKGNTTVNIWGTPTICRDVYGGGNLGSVGDPEEVKGTAGVDGRDKFGFKTGLTTVNILGGNIYGNVYGASRGGASILHEYADMSYVKNTLVTITGAAKIVADPHTDGDNGGFVYGGGNAGHVRRNTEVTVGGADTISVDNGSGTPLTVTAAAGGKVGATLYGAGRGDAISATAGLVNHNVLVNINDGSLIGGNVYGGGAIGNSNVHDQRNTETDNDDCKEICTTTVNLNGGVVLGDAYGGAQGIKYNAADYAEYSAAQKAIIESNCAAIVYGDVTLTLNGTAFKPADHPTHTNADGSAIPVAGRVFGCNNINGTPKGTVLVKVLQTRGLTATTTASGTTYTVKDVDDKPAKVEMLTDATPGTYELQAVYGGGNLADYEPVDPEANGRYTTNHDATKKPVQVIIDGCGETSIAYVYGGGNAAPTPSTDVLILGTYEVGQVFGGGNGKDDFTYDGNVWNDNDGADVGIVATSHEPSGKAIGTTYGTGDTNVNVLGGTIHRLLGGSNTKGDIVGTANVVLGDENLQTCELCIDEAYGGGNEAFMSGGANTAMKCIGGLKQLYGGARNADVSGDIELNVTGGYYGKVFGGNNLGGTIHGRITVNVKEEGCLPIYIGELYGGGNQAAYSVEDVTDKDDELLYKQFPKVNIISASYIGTVFGGGFGASATVTGNPHVNINMERGTADGEYTWNEAKSLLGLGLSGTEPFYTDLVNNYKASSKTDPATSAERPTSYFDALKFNLGTIGTVFGGGNQAEVRGDTYVSIGTGLDEEENELTRRSAQITGNVFGGGNNAKVTGNSHVNIGKQ